MKANYNKKKFFDDRYKDSEWRDKFIMDAINDAYGTDGAAPERINQDGVVYINGKTKDGNQVKLRLDTVVWGLYHDAIPDGYTLIHNDGDYTNCNLSNLSSVKVGSARHRAAIALESKYEHKL